MFGGPKKKTETQAKAVQPKAATNVMSRPGSAAPKPATGSASGASQPPRAAAPQERGEQLVSIGAAVTIRGDITGKGNLVIGGRVEGTVDLPDNDANVEKAGLMQGGIVAKNVNIRGKVDGDIEARRKVTIFATGTVVGTIISPRIEIEDGAKFKGRIDMGSPVAATSLKPNKARPAVDNRPSNGA